VRSDNWTEKLGAVSVSDVAVVTGNHVPGGGGDLCPVTLRDVLANMGTFGGYAGLPAGADLSHVDLDRKVSIRFQTTFLPVVANMEFCSEAYNYNTMSDEDPRNLILLCTTQGLAVQQDGRGAQKLFHHGVDRAGKIHRYWLEAERSQHKVGGPQVETENERKVAAARGKATSSVIGVRAMGTRFNVLMSIQVPLEQAPQPNRYSFGVELGSSFGVELGACQFGAALSMGDYSGEDELLIGASADFAPRSARCLMKRSSAPRVGSACAARVSRGAEFDTWKGLTAKMPKRNALEHVTCTVVIYNAVSGGVPSEADVISAIDDLEQLYAACSTQGYLADQQFDFMKTELTAKDANDIADKISTQPYKPPEQTQPYQPPEQKCCRLQ